MKCIATFYYGFDGGYIYKFEYGINDKVVFQWLNQKRTYKSTIRYDSNDRAYFTTFNKKIYLNECPKVDF